VTPHKHLEPALAAFAALRRELPEARFLICGEVSPHYDLAARLRELGSAGITVTGRLPREAFEAAMTAADVAVNLRHPTGGETSASLLELLALGKPTIVSDLGSFAEIPAGVVAHVAVDEDEPRHLLALFRALAGDSDLRSDLSAAARRHVERAHAVDRTAAAYIEVLAELAAGRPAAPAPEAPPLGRPLGVDPRHRLAASIGEDAAELGLDERDSAGALRSIAADLAELGWAPSDRPG
jgi:glycosyltransferase involved in cell wall biosynthesis